MVGHFVISVTDLQLVKLLTPSTLKCSDQSILLLFSPIFPSGKSDCNKISYIIRILYLMQKHLRCKKVRPSKVESYLEVNALRDWRQQDLISEYGQGA